MNNSKSLSDYGNDLGTVISRLPAQLCHDLQTGREVTFSQITVNMGFFKSTAGWIACIGVALNPPVAELSGEGITSNILY